MLASSVEAPQGFSVSRSPSEPLIDRPHSDIAHQAPRDGPGVHTKPQPWSVRCAAVDYEAGSAVLDLLASPLEVPL
jgi:hypothetical protein